MTVSDPYAPQRALFEEWAKTRGLNTTLRIPGNVQMNYCFGRARDAWAGWLHAGGSQAPIDMVLHCPACGVQHIDAPEETDPSTWTAEQYGHWTNPPHRSHLCADCGHVWRPADVPTNGVRAATTVGKNDSPIVVPAGRTR